MNKLITIKISIINFQIRGLYFDKESNEQHKIYFFTQIEII